ncbi:MAG: response regulator [Sphaerochaeta sp.]|nr:response regulator [Sphaerochaeta sp.]
MGPRSDVDEVSDALTHWKAIRVETVRLLRASQIEEVENRVKATGVGGVQADKIILELDILRNFALAKTDELFEDAQEHRTRIIEQMVFLCIGVLFLLVALGLYLRKSFLPPIAKLTDAIEMIKQGKLDTRIGSESPNEFGELARAFDTMSDTIQRETIYNTNIVRISSSMFKHRTLRPFCQELLNNLQVLTDSQICALYFLHETNSQFERYESIGLKHDSLCSFSVAAKEGEFGAALASKKVQHVTDIPSDVQVLFPTVSGDFKVKEIITIPIIQGDEVISVISLGSIKRYPTDAVRLIHGLLNEITASLSAVLSAQRAMEFSQELQQSNRELEQQARELEMQANELTEQNAELEMQKKQLDEASRLKTNFLSNMSHELRTPLNSVIALSGVLGRRLANKIPEEESGYLEIIERNGRNLLTMINDILDISRIEAGREDIEITQFNSNTVIGEVVAMIQPQAQSQNIELLHTAKNPEIAIETDAKKFRHILQNLISNAVKFTEKGTVEIASEQNGDSIVISVKDSGIGISEEHLSHIFEEFRQADGSTSRRFGGTGLGLAIAKKYATLLNGTITIESTPKVGSEFTLTLPLRYDAKLLLQGQAPSDPYQKEGSLSLPQDVPDLSGRTILLVDDNESSLIQIKDLMEGLGCHVRYAPDALEAFTIIDQGVPDAIILDLMMPDVDGFKVLELLRNAEATANIPVLVLTVKHITKEELKFLKRNNVHQLIQRGDVKRLELQQAVATMLYPKNTKANQKSPKVRALAGKPVVLVVEDNRDNMITVQALLRDHHTVLEAFTASEGIKMARAHVPDLILMDIALPDFNGIDAFKKLRSLPQTQHIPVIALTASVLKHDRETILSHGFDAFIGKPIIADEFYRVLDEVLNGK